MSGYALKAWEPQAQWAPADTLNAGETLKQFHAARSPKVVLVGDSLSSGAYLGSGFVASFAAILEKKIRGASPRPVRFVNRAMGGMRFFDFGKATAPTAVDQATYPWYTDTARPWMDYVKDEQPDLVIIAFGMNDGTTTWDSGNFPQDQFYAAINRLRAFPKPPSIILCTPILPALKGAYGTEAEQRGRDAVAGFIRSYAQFAGIAYLDFNRAFSVVRDGRDILDCKFSKVAYAQTLPFTAPNKVREYAITLTVNAAPGDFFTRNVLFALSPNKSNFLVVRDVAGKLWVDVYTESNGRRLIARNTGVSTPAAGENITLAFRLSGNCAAVSLGGVELFNDAVVRFGGTFAPSVRHSDGAVGANAQISLWSGAEAAYRPKFTDDELYAVVDGGNGLNHVSPAGSQAAFFDVVDKQRWFAPQVRQIGANAARLLRGFNGIALDFESKEYAVIDENSTSCKAGPLADVVQMAAGVALEYKIDAATGATLGVRCVDKLGYVALSAFPFNAAEGTLIVEAYQEVAGAANFLVALSRDPNNGVRMETGIHTNGAQRSSGYDDASALQFDMFGSTTFPIDTTVFARYAFAYKVNDFKQVTNGDRRNGNVEEAGALPTALTRLRIGHRDASVAQSPLVIRSIVYIPASLDPVSLIRTTI